MFVLNSAIHNCYFLWILLDGILLDAKAQYQLRIRNEAEKTTVEFYYFIFIFGNKDQRN